VSDLRSPAGIPLPQGLGEDPLSQYTRIFVRFFQLVFQSFKNGEYHWEPDPSVSEIVIQGEAPIDTTVVEKRPALIVQRGPVQFTNVSMDQFAGPLLDPKTGKVSPNFNYRTGARRHTDLLNSVMSVSCLAREGLEAQRLAYTCAYSVRALKRSLMKCGIHRVGEDISVSPESPPGSIVQPDTKEISLVAVSLPFLFQQTWTVEPLDKTLLTRVAVALRSEAGYPDDEAQVLRPPGMNGQPLNALKVTSLNQVVGINRAVAPTPKK
jgi:hypothetical protein